MLLSFSLFFVFLIVNDGKAKQMTALKYSKSEQIKATMVKRTRQNRIGLLILFRHIPEYYLQSGVILLPPKRSDFYAASRTGLLWRSVNSS